VVPMSSGNWASGINDIDQLYALRLNPAAQTPHPPGSLFDADETLINVIKIKRGFLSQIRWSRNDDVGKILGEFGACPDKPCAFPIVAISDPPNVREAYIVPPVSVLTSFNCYWRGDLELEFDLIASVSHKGSIMVTYLPGAIYADVANTQADFNSGHNAVFKLDGKTSFVFRVPFISDKPWWSVGETFGDEKRVQLPPGIIYVTVVNRLCIMNAVSDEININVYLKGADNFEVAVPTPPSYIPFWNGASVPLTQRGLFQKPGYDGQIAFGNWRYASAGVLRYSTVADHITQWDGRSHPFGIYEIDPINSPRLSLNGKVVNNRGVTMTVRLNYFVRFICNGDRDSYFYMTAFQTLNQAQTYVNKWRVLGNDDPLSNSPQMYMLKGVEEPDYVDGKIILRFIGFSCEPQMDSAYISFSNAATTTNNGRIQFGESFVDVIDYMRRYQPYCNFTAITTSYMSEDVFQLQYKIPIFPIGLDIAESVDFSKVTKGGVIPLLLSAYRFYRGALRFRIVVNCKDDIKMFVQHRMDQIPSSRKMVQGTHKSDYYQTLESGYAQSYCFTKINPVTTIEVPFYNNGVLALLQNPNFKSISEIQHYSLGFLSFAFFSSAKVSFNVQLYYSIADDFKPSNFIGFGPLSSITNILPKENLDEKESFERLCAEQEFFQQREVMASDSEDSYMESPPRSYVSDSHPKTVSQVVSGQNTFVRTWLHGEQRPVGHDVDVIHAEPNGLFDKIFSKTAKDVVDAKFAELKEDPSDLYNMINEFLKPYFEKLIDVGSDVKGRISTIVSNLVHALISRTWPSVCFAMIAILECLGLIRTKFVAMLGNLFTKLLSYCEKISSFASKFFSEDVQLSSTPEFDVVEHNSKKGEDFDHKDLVSGFSTILSIVVNSADLVYRRVSTGSFFSEKHGFIGLFKNFVSTANGLFVFFKNTIEWFIKLYKKVLFKFSGKSQLQYLYAEEADIVEIWFMDCAELVDHYTEKQIIKDAVLSAKVYYCASIADCLKQKFADMEWADDPTDEKFKKAKMLTSTMVNRIIDLRKSLMKYSQTVPVRFEPFVLCQSGNPGVGKSFVTNSLSKKLLSAISWSGQGETMFVRTPGNKYWNGLETQPVLVYDDYLAMTSVEAVDADISDLMLLKSSAVFNPPQAAIDDKYRRYNPYCVFLNTNKPYLHVQGVSCQQAWRRRRDIVVDFRLKPEYEGKAISEIPSEVLNEFGHLVFSVYASNLVEGQGDTRFKKINGKVDLSYVEYERYVCEQFKKYYDTEMVNYRKRCDDEYFFRTSSDGTLNDVITQYAEFIGRLTLKKELATDKQELFHRRLNELFTDMNFTSQVLPPEVESTSCRVMEKMISRILSTYRQENEIFSSVCGENIEAQGGRKDFIAAVGRTKCKHAHLFDHISRYEYYGNISDVFKMLRQDALLSRLCIDVEDFYFISSDFMSCMQSDMETNELVAYHDTHDFCIVGVRRCGEDCFFEVSENGRTAAECFWKNYLKHNRINYADLPPTVQQTYTSAMIYDKRTKTQRLIASFKSLLRDIGFVASKLYFGKLLSCVFKFLKYVLQLVVLCSVSALVTPPIFKMVHGITDSCGKMPQMTSYNDYIPKGHLRKPVVARKTNITSQMSDQTQFNLVGLLKKNTFDLTVHTESTSVKMRCVGLQSNVFMMLDHYHDFIHNTYLTEQTKPRITISNSKMNLPIDYADLRFVRFSNSALVLARLPTYLGYQFKNLMKHIVDQRGSVVVPDRGKIVEINDDDVLIHDERIKRLDRLVVDADVEQAGDTYVETVYRHSISRRGLCGALLVADTNTVAPILGVHIAGAKHRSLGFCEALCRETLSAGIEELFKDGSNVFQFADVDHLVVEGSPKLTLESKVEELGVVSKELTNMPPQKSKLEKSECFEAFFSTTSAPPILHPRDERLAEDAKFSPLKMSCLFHGYVPTPFEADYFDLAADQYRSLILSVVRPKRVNVRGVLDVESAIVGIPEYGYDSMEMNTSEGFPYVNYRPKGAHDKKWLVDLRQEGGRMKLYGLHDMLQKEMREKMNARENNIVPTTVFIDCLKDMKLPTEKVFVPGKTRVFSLSPVDFTIQFRQYYLDFMASFQDARFDADHAIGMDVESIEWHNLVLTLHENSLNIVVGDYQKFGPTLMKKCVDECFEIIVSWYELYYDNEDSDSTVRRVMGQELSTSLHLMLDNLYRSFCGAPSGSPITTILNSMVNSLYMRTAWVAIMGKKVNFDDYVKMISYGDDLIASIKDEVVGHFNCITLAKFFSKYGIGFTDARKSVDFSAYVPYMHIEDPDVTFLKNTFVKHPNRPIYISKLDERSIQEIGNWVMKTATPIEVSKDACIMLVRKHFPYGKDEYEKMRKMVISFWNRKNEKIIIPSWNEVDMQMFD